MIIIFTTKKDVSLGMLIASSKKYGIDVKVIYYEDISIIDHNIITNNIRISIRDEDKIIPRDPYNTGSNYSYIVSFLLINNFNQIVYDRYTLLNYPNYEDKLFQMIFLSSQKTIKVPITSYFTRIDTNTQIKFPSVIKKRFSSRAKDVYLVSNIGELNNILHKKDVSDYILQEPLHIKSEYRVLMLNDKFIGAVKKSTKFPDLESSQKVRVLGPCDVSRKIKDISINLARLYGSTLLGIDVCETVDGYTYVLEVNLSPQFNSFQTRTRISISDRVIATILN